jgi:hypothetical protein
MAKRLAQAISLAVTLPCVILAPATSSAGSDPDKSRRGPSGTALAFFEGIDTTDVDAFLTRIRPLPLSPALKAQVIANLPTEGELRPAPKDLLKLAIAESILKFHQRKDAIEVRLIDVKHAFVGLHARSVLLISRDALDLVRPQELQALIAHELGHEYFWDEYTRAMADHDDRRMQELELRCDGIAVLTLRQLALDPEDLVRAVTSLTRYNERLGAVASADSYAALGDRVRFIRSVQRLLDAQDQLITRTAR